MIPLALLKRATQQALRHLARVKDLQEVEVFASSSEELVCRLNYTSEIPCHGVEEPKSSESFGLGIRAVFTSPDGPRVGFGSEARDFSIGAARRALENARATAALDSEFVSLPRPEPASGRRKPARLGPRADPALMALDDAGLVELGWQVIHKALHAFESSQTLASLTGSKEKLASLGMIVGGDVSVSRQRMAIASTHHPTAQGDEWACLTSPITAMVESRQAKGTGYAATDRLAKFHGESGGEAARRAVAAIGGRRVATGDYTVVLGPQPISDLMANLILPSLSADAFFSSRSCFFGELERPVASPLLSVYDDGATKGLVGARRLTCEGLPTGRTDLIRNGTLTGVLSNYYETQRLFHDSHAREKLGVHPQDHAHALAPRNGLRLARGGGGPFEVTPSICATNVVIEGSGTRSLDALLRAVNQGVYIGRIWYTYPVNGLRAGDFTCTIVGDSYLIENGRIGAPIEVNAVRMTGNIRLLLRNIIGITAQRTPIMAWGSPEVIYAPNIACRGIRLSEIAQSMRNGVL